LADLKADFAASTKDSDFVKSNSDNKVIKGEYMSPSSIPGLAAEMATAQVGNVFGPYMEGNEYKLMKVRSVQEMPDSAKARHILIRVANGDSLAAMKRADSLKTAIKSGKTTFADAAKKFSEDPGSAEKGGDLGWFREGAMVPEFNDACFSGKKGEMTVVKTNFGYHLIELMDQGPRSKRLQAFFVTRKVEPSTATDRQVYAKANGFASKYSAGADFDKGVAAEKLNKRNADNIKENDRSLGGLEQPRELIRWAFKANKDDVSKVYQFGNQYVIAHLVAVHEKGIATMDEIKDQITAMVKKEKKAAQFIEKMQGTSDLNALAAKVKLSVETADNVNFANSYILNYGNEPAIVGAFMTLKQGSVTKPIEGRRAVYVARVDAFTEPAAKTDFKDDKASLSSTLNQRVDYQLFNALKDKAEVEDNRARFY
jgi:peptidyl-prolyl cis-trans isomerase D